MGDQFQEVKSLIRESDLLVQPGRVTEGLRELETASDAERASIRAAQDKAIPLAESQSLRSVDETVKGGENAVGSVAPARTSSRPEWLRRLDEGNAFNRSQAHRYPHNEVYVNKPSGSGYYRVDSYNPRSGEIVSRKFTQFSDIQESTGIGYVNEFTRKYSPGTTIADVPSSGSLAGQRLQGQMILEVPVQTRPIPQGVLDAANDAGVIIRDINGRIY